MITLALRIIAHRPARFLVALLGISMAAGLALIQLGLYRGFRENASVVPDHTEGELWVRAQYTKNFDFPNLLGGRSLDRVRALSGVAAANPMLILFAKWKLPSGALQTVQVIGFDAPSGAGGPWTMIDGFPGDLAPLGHVTVDETTRHKLAGAAKGTEARINGIKVKVAGITDGIQSFQGNPVVFADVNTVRAIGRLPADALHYILVRLAPQVDAAEVLERLNRIEFVEAYTREEIARKAQQYWLQSTGAGIALSLFAVLGLFVGIVVAGQVLYTSTLEHLREYGTLKAIGASNFQVAGAIVTQAVTWALPAHLMAGGLLWLATNNIQGKGIHLSLDPHTYALLGLGTVGVCVLSSLLSVARVMRLQPADVFKS